MTPEPGHNGTINGQGQSWWTKHRKKLLNNTRGSLIQIMWSRDIVISNITLRDSPFWTLHPYDCKNLTIANLTILAPVKGAPNTDGIDPDSCEDMLIENCYISTGDDGIAIKSGWDQYGITYGHPSTNITIRNLTIRSAVRKHGATVTLGHAAIIEEVSQDSDAASSQQKVNDGHSHVRGHTDGFCFTCDMGLLCSFGFKRCFYHDVMYQIFMLNEMPTGQFSAK